MKRFRVMTALAFCTLAACGGDDDTVIEVAEDDGNFTTLVNALEETGLDDTLEGDGPFTVFAPTDDAFARLPDGVLASLDADTLSTILTYHVVADSVLAADVVELDSATTVEGSDIGIQVFDGTVLLDGTVQIVTTDIQADNGVIHVVDAVLLPPSVPFPGDIVQALQAYPVFSTLVDAVVDADLVSVLQGDNEGDGFTVFAPTNFAFDDVDLAALSAAELEDVLLYHVVPATVPAAMVVELDSATTALGEDIAIDASSSVVLNGESNVIRTDLEANNGIIHVIDTVLTP